MAYQDSITSVASMITSTSSDRYSNTLTNQFHNINETREGWGPYRENLRSHFLPNSTLTSNEEVLWGQVDPLRRERYSRPNSKDEVIMAIGQAISIKNSKRTGYGTWLRIQTWARNFEPMCEVSKPTCKIVKSTCVILDLCTKLSHVIPVLAS